MKRLFLHAYLRAIVTIAVGGGVLLLGGGRRYGLALIVLGLLDVGIALWARGAYEIDPAVDEALEQAMKVSKTDPAAADRILDAAFTRQAEGQDREIAALRARAPFDRVAGEKLRKRLQRNLALNLSGRKRFEKEFAGEAEWLTMVRRLDEEAAALQRQLVELDQHLLRLRS